MKKIIFIFAIFRAVCASELNDRCGNDWISYRKEKCFKLIRVPLMHSDAEAICKNHGIMAGSTATIASINSAAEREFLLKNVIDSSVSQNIWINCACSTCNALQLSDRGAVDIRSVGCELRNFALCEILQWSTADLLRAIADTRTQLEELKAKTVEVAQRNPIPVGFIYTQLPGQGEPYDIWGYQMVWSEITTEYAGLFFRVLGGESEAFNVTQAANDHRLLRANTVHVQPGISNIAVSPNEVWSAGVLTGKIEFAQTTAFGVRFLVSGGEIRPRNTAVRIWKRIY